MNLGLTPKPILLITSNMAYHSRHGANSIGEVASFSTGLSGLARTQSRNWIMHETSEGTEEVKKLQQRNLGVLTHTRLIFRILLVCKVPLYRIEKSTFSGQMNYNSHS